MPFMQKILPAGLRCGLAFAVIASAALGISFAVGSPVLAAEVP